jgi:hypothetical protein
MKKSLTLILIFIFTLGSVPSSYAGWGDKGPSQKAVENASDEAVFHRIGDWFATVGKNDTEKKQILAKRKAARAAARAQKKARRTQEQARKKTGEMKKNWDK